MQQRLAALMPAKLLLKQVEGRIDSPFLLPSEGRCLIENATQGVGTSEGENEETDQADFAPRSDGCN
jgi:hypothetical protein